METNKTFARIIRVDANGVEYAMKDGKVYKLNNIDKTMKKVYEVMTNQNSPDLSKKSMSMTAYRKCLKDTFDGEDAPIKNGKLHFRGYRISCDAENGFMVEDTLNHYEIVDTGFDGIPTPKELCEWFAKPKKVVEYTPEQLKQFEQKRKEREQAKKEARERKAKEREGKENPDFEKLRKNALRTIRAIREKTVSFNPTQFSDLIPFRRWKRNANKLIKQWSEKKLRYARMLNELERITAEETFVVTEKYKKNTFKGTIIPEFSKVGNLAGDKIEVDGQMIDAVPFLTEYLLCEKPKAMYQLMRFAKGEINEFELFANPIVPDGRIEYDKKALANNEFNTRILCMLYSVLYVTLPQDILYESDLRNGDKIAIILDGKVSYRTIQSTERGVFISTRLGYLLKYDTWVKLPKRNDKAGDLD